MFWKKKRNKQATHLVNTVHTLQHLKASIKLIEEYLDGLTMREYKDADVVDHYYCGSDCIMAWMFEKYPTIKKALEEYRAESVAQ